MSDDAETYAPEPVGLADGDILIGDPREFFDLTQSLLAINRGGTLFVLRRETMKWESVESLAKPTGSNVTPLKPAPRRTD